MNYHYLVPEVPRLPAAVPREYALLEQKYSVKDFLDLFVYPVKI